MEGIKGMLITQQYTAMPHDEWTSNECACVFAKHFFFLFLVTQPVSSLVSIKCRVIHRVVRFTRKRKESAMWKILLHKSKPVVRAIKKRNGLKHPHPGHCSLIMSFTLS